MVKVVYPVPDRLSRIGAGENFWILRLGILAWLLYNVLWLPAQLIFKLFFGLKTKSQLEPAKLQGPLVIAANHGCWLDPFWIGAAFPFAARVYPIRYGTWHRFFHVPFLLPFLVLIGCFPIRKKIGLDKSLAAGLTILRRGGVVGIFPEGKRRLAAGRPKKGRRGAAYLAVKTGAPVLPVKIKGNVNVALWGSFLGRHKIELHLGKPFYLAEVNPDSLEQLSAASDLIMRKIREL